MTDTKKRNRCIVRLASAKVPVRDIEGYVARKFPPAITRRRIRQIATAAGIVFDIQNTGDLVADDVLEKIVLLELRRGGVNYGYRLLMPDIEDQLPAGTRVSQRQLLRVLFNLAPAAFQARLTQATRKLTRRTVFAPYRGFRWEIDSNEKLAFVGLHITGIWDSCCHRNERMVVVDNKLPYTQFKEVTEPLIGMLGFPDTLCRDKGDENMLTGFVCRAAAADDGRLAADGSWTGPKPDRMLPSKRQPGIERSWAESNSRVALPVYSLVDAMEASNLLDLTQPTHLGAMQQLLRPLVQHACDLLRHRWNRHLVRSGRRPSGIPDRIAEQHPHPGGRSQLLPGIDFVARFERARGKPMRKEPAWRARRDSLHGQPNNQAARTHAVMLIWGSPELAWTDILLYAGRHRFVPAFREFLRH